MDQSEKDKILLATQREILAIRMFSMTRQKSLQTEFGLNVEDSFSVFSLAMLYALTADLSDCIQLTEEQQIEVYKQLSRVVGDWILLKQGTADAPETND